ncbi:MAG: TonB-dependent receptor [Hyphomonadaceae bacterium]|nr:TonB-dependent receptor [Hyphomonadaceae bacterium]
MLRIMLLGGAALAAAVSPGPGAYAQDGATEIIVTARKREERLFDVPGPVNAIAGAQIEALRVQDARDLLTLTPNAFLQENNAGTARDISLRGVSTPSLFAEPGVSLYVDDVYSSGFISFPTQFIDVARIEVLRGPQGALYGRNAVGGAVNVLSNGPGEDFEAAISAVYASNDRTELQGILSGPLGARAGVRLAAWSANQEEGDYFNPVSRRYLDSSETSGARLVFEAAPVNALSLSLIAETSGGDIPGTYLYFPTAGETKETVRRDTHPENDYDATRFVARADYESEAGIVSAILGWRDYALDGLEDTDLSDQAAFGSPLAALGQQITTRTNESESTFAELRWLSPQFGATTVLAGLTYFDESAVGDIATDLRGASLAFTGGALPAVLAINNDQTVESLAAFVEATMQLDPTWSLIAALRYTRDEKRVDFAFNPSPLLAGFGLFPSTLRTSDSFENVSPGVTLAWSPGEDTRVYARVQSGFRAGGFNFNVGSTANLPYEEETSINYEIGAKQRFADGRGFVGATAFWLTQEDVLVPFFDLAQPTGLQGYLDNAGDAETLGVELEASWRLTEALTIGGSLGYLDAQFTTGALDGNDLPSAREWTYALTVALDQPINDQWRVLADAALTHRADGFQDAANAFAISAADILNVSAGIGFGHAELRAFAQNALNDDYDIAFGGFRAPSATGVIRAPEATYGVRLRLAY